jgi:predicted permease
VTGPGFRGTEVTLKADFFLPFSQISEMQRLGENPERMTSYGSQWLYALGRPQTNVDAAQVKAELDLVSAGIRERNPSSARDRVFHAERAGQVLPAIRQRVMPAFLVLLAVTVLVLLTACANIANLMLARASVRGKEIATRLAIGAGRGRMIRQLMTESMLLALTGGALGVGLAVLASRCIASFRLPLPVPIDLTAPIDSRVVLFAVGLSIATAIAFGLVPAFRASRSDLTGALGSVAGQTAGVRRFGMRNGLVVGQVAISGVLVICSGLFLRSLGAAGSADSGMEIQDLTLVRFDPALNRYGQDETRRLLLDILELTETLPEVRAASVVDRMPLSFGGNFTQVSVEDRDDNTRTAAMTVGPRYFETMGIALLAGEEFRPLPSEEAVVIVSQDLAAKLFPAQNALGRYIVENGRPARIIAVAANAKFAELQEAEAAPVLYRPILDSDGPVAGFGGLTLIAKAARNSGPLGATIRRRLLSRDPELVVNLAGTMESHVQESLFVPRLLAMLFGVSGLIGLLIASAGIYGVMSFAVARRTREIAIRLALGARSAQVTWMVLSHGALLALVGIAIGLAGGMALAATAGSLIYGVSATDPLTFTAVPAILLSVALLAAAIPARRAARVLPNRALRAE